MASFLASSHLILLARKPTRNPRLLPLSKSLSLANSNNLNAFSLASYSGGSGGVSDEWGEKSTWEPSGPPSSDPPKEDDEWGREGDSGSGKKRIEITDEWGEKTELEPEPASEPDPPKDEDEWGNGNDNGSIPSKSESEDAPSKSESEDAPSKSESESESESEDDTADKLTDLKRCIVDSIYGTELGYRGSPEDRADILELVSQLEAANPNPNPLHKPHLLDGNWILLYTSFSELLPLLAVGSTPFLRVKKISQEINSSTKTIINATTLTSPVASFSFSASASFEVRTPSRIQVQFKEGTLQPPEIKPTIDLPGEIGIFGQRISLEPVRQALNPVQNVFLNIASVLSGQPPLKVPIPSGNRAESWLLTTYLDEELRISRGDGGLFVLAKEGSSLLAGLI